MSYDVVVVGAGVVGGGGSLSATASMARSQALSFREGAPSSGTPERPKFWRYPLGLVL